MTRVSISVIVLTVASVAHADEPSRHLYFTAGIPVYTASAKFPCRGDSCYLGDTIDFKTDNMLGVAVGIGWRFNRFLAVESNITLPLVGSSTHFKDVNSTAQGWTLNDYHLYRADIRGDLPLTRTLSMFASYGIAYQGADFSEGAYTDTNYRTSGTLKVPFFGAEWRFYHERAGAQIVFIPRRTSDGVSAEGVVANWVFAY